MASNRDPRLLCLLAYVALLFAACGDDDGPAQTATLTIVAPTNAQVVTVADDEDAATAGIQFDVQVRATNLPDTDVIEILLDDEVATSTMPAGTALIEVPVTLPPGEHTLQARVGEQLRSNVVTFTVEPGGGGCGSVRFETPSAPAGTGSIRLGPDDDTDGEPCGATFTTSITVGTDAPEGTPARLTVNGMVRAMARVASGGVTFSGVRLDNRGDTPNRFSVAIGEGEDCDEAFPAAVLVTCAGPSCSIGRPDTERPYLNATDDTSAADGFQTDFEVVTDTSAIGQEARLVVDEAPSGMAAVVADPEGARATIANVALSEGEHVVRAECRDAEGNVTSSSEVTWTVDSIPCEVDISSPTDGELLTDVSDLDPGTDGVQITILGSTGGTDCEAARGGVCSGIEVAPFDDLGGATDLALVATLGSGPRQDLCAQVRDVAGNVGEGRVSIRFRSDAPQLEITTPTAGTSFNLFGDATHTGDLDQSTPTCEALFVVRCTDLGHPVVLSLDGDPTRTPLPGGTATCTATSGLPDPFLGEARFASVSLPRTAPVAVVASQIGDGGTLGLSERLALSADCEAPVLTVNRPMCGAVLGSADDEDPAMLGVQHRVVVLNTNEPPPAVTLEIRSGSSVVYRETSTMREGLTNTFPSATFGAGGLLLLEACANDDVGNRGCAPACVVTVSGLPNVVITAPHDGDALAPPGDCDLATPGLQINVQATTDAADGSSASITVGSGAPVLTTVMGGLVRGCVPAADGTSVPVVVSVEDGRGRGMTSVRVNVDTMAPTGAIGDLSATVVDRRAGTARLSWTAVGDAPPGALASLELRCARAPITTEDAWTAARIVPVATPPGSPGAVQSEVVSGFRTGFREQCTLRGRDVGMMLTPIGNSVTIDAPFMEREMVTAVPTSAGGTSLAAVGDVNGDGIDDFLAGGTGAAYLFFGSATALPGTPGVTFVGSAAAFFGYVVAGVGDVNADGIADLAISAFGANSFAGAVFVFFGHGPTTIWPPTIDVDLGGCAADLCLRSDDGVPGAGPDELAFLGSSLANAGDFDGDGIDDLVIGAPSANTAGTVYPGAVYVVRGSATLGGTVALPGTAATTLSGFVIDVPPGFQQFGTGVAGLGNVGGGPGDDLALGAAGNAPAEGGIFTVLGRAHPGTGIVAIAPAELGIVNRGAPNTLGSTVVNAGDVDNNGMVDVGSYETLHPGGQATVYLGVGGGYVASSVRLLQNDSVDRASDSFGRFIGTGVHTSPLVGATGILGDLDRDGRSDVLVGATQLDTMPAAGQLYYSGLVSELPAVARSLAHATFSPATAEPMPFRIPQFVGDVNGDGFLDLAVGDPDHLADTGRVVVYY